MTTQEHIDKLRADIATLKAAMPVMQNHSIGCTAILSDSLDDLNCQLAELEKQAVDPWKEAKNWCYHWESDYHGFSPKRKVVSYVRHLENELELFPKMLELLSRYRNETPIGHQPHMIAHDADEVIKKAMAK